MVFMTKATKAAMIPKTRTGDFLIQRRRAGCRGLVTSTAISVLDPVELNVLSILTELLHAESPTALSPGVLVTTQILLDRLLLPVRNEV